MTSILRYLKDNKGATALEFAILAVPLLMGLFAIIELSYKGIIQNELDNKLYVVSSEIGINNFTSDNASEFMRDEFCPDIGTTFMKCDEIEIGVRVLPGRPYLYRNDTVIGQWDLGCTSDVIMIELNYPVTNLVHPIAIADITTRSNEKYYRSRSVIRREPLLSGGSSC